MRIAAFESSGSRCGVALADDSGPLIDWSGEFGPAIAGPMLEGLRGLLQSLEWGLVDIDAFAAGVGPGSFTGIKIATTIAKTLAHAEGRSVIGVGTLEAIANDARASGPIVALLPAKKGWVYMQRFENHSALARPETVALDEAPARLAAMGEVLVAGPVDLADMPANATQVTSLPAGANSVARLALRKARDGEILRPVELLPLYVAPPSVTMPKKPFR